jgi:hypothetical protein
VQEKDRKNQFPIQEGEYQKYQTTSKLGSITTTIWPPTNASNGIYLKQLLYKFYNITSFAMLNNIENGAAHIFKWLLFISSSICAILVKVKLPGPSCAIDLLLIGDNLQEST